MLRVFKHHIAFSTVILAVLESALLFAVLYALLRLAPGAQGGLPVERGRDLYLIAPVTALGFVIMAAVGLYNREIFFDMRIVLSRAAISIAFIVVVLLGVVYAYTTSLAGNYEYYYTVCLAGVVLHLVMILLIRMIFLQLVNLDTFKRRVLVVGSGPVLIGTFDARWAFLDSDARRAHASLIARALRAAGVQEALLLDPAGRLELHFADGEVRFVKEPRL